MNRTCEHCGQAFANKRKQVVRFCSEQCRRKSAKKRQPHMHSHRTRAAYYGVPYETVDSRVVMERDSWTCGICGKAIDASLPSTHHMSASIDHVTPMSRGGAHAYSNVQAAHMWCNSMKRAG